MSPSRPLHCHPLSCQSLSCRPLSCQFLSYWPLSCRSVTLASVMSACVMLASVMSVCHVGLCHVRIICHVSLCHVSVSSQTVSPLSCLCYGYRLTMQGMRYAKPYTTACLHGSFLESMTVYR